MYDSVSTKDKRSDGRNKDNNNDDQVEGLSESSKAPQEYAIDHIGPHIGRGPKVKTCSKYYDYNSADDTAERHGQIPWHYILAFVARYTENGPGENWQDISTNENQGGNRSEINDIFIHCVNWKCPMYHDEKHDRSTIASTKTVSNKPYWRQRWRKIFRKALDHTDHGKRINKRQWEACWLPQES